MLELKTQPLARAHLAPVHATELATLGRIHRGPAPTTWCWIASTGAIRNAAALIDVSPLMKYLISGPDAANLLHRVTPRDIHKMSVGQVCYTGWCDEEGKMLDDGTIARLAEDSFRLTSAEPSLRWLAMNARGMDVQISETHRQHGGRSACRVPNPAWC
jgi:glycine cleavage system aminomethyltransferase T